MPLLRRKSIAQTDTSDTWMWSFRGSIFTIFTIKMTPSRWRVSTLICAIISLRWHGEAGAFRENWRIFRLFLLFSYRLITASAFKRTTIAPAIQGLLYPFLSLTSFNSSFGYSRINLPHCHPYTLYLYLGFLVSAHVEKWSISYLHIQ